jgi:hypothetical protein
MNWLFFLLAILIIAGIVWGSIHYRAKCKQSGSALNSDQDALDEIRAEGEGFSVSAQKESILKANVPKSPKSPK